MHDFRFTIRDPYESFGDLLELRYAFRHDRQVHVATSVNMTVQEDGTAFPMQPMMRVEREVGQQMMDELWKLGFRPSFERKQQQDNLLWYQEQLAKFITKSTR